MIGPLRIAHRRTFQVLAIGLPILLAVSVLARHSRPIVALEYSPGSEFRQLSVSPGNFHSHKLQLRSFAKGESTDRYLLVEPGADFAEPDVLVYWTTSEPRDQTLPSDAHLIGGIGSQFPSRLPDLVEANHQGYLVLFSSAHFRVVDWTPLRAQP